MCPITSYRASLTLSSTRARASDSLYSLWVHIGEASSLGGCVEFGNPKIKNHLREGWWLWLLYINISTTPNSGGSSKADKMVSFPRQPHQFSTILQVHNQEELGSQFVHIILSLWCEGLNDPIYCLLSLSSSTCRIHYTFRHEFQFERGKRKQWSSGHKKHERCSICD